MNVAWVYDCGDSHKNSGQSSYLWWLGKLRSGSSRSEIEFVSIDPEAERWQDNGEPDPLPGGIMDSRRGGDFVRVSESVGEGRLPPGMRSVKVAPRGSRK